VFAGAHWNLLAVSITSYSSALNVVSVTARWQPLVRRRHPVHIAALLPGGDGKNGRRGGTSVGATRGRDGLWKSGFAVRGVWHSSRPLNYNRRERRWRQAAALCAFACCSLFYTTSYPITYHLPTLLTGVWWTLVLHSSIIKPSPLSTAVRAGLPSRRCTFCSRFFVCDALRRARCAVPSVCHAVRFSAALPGDVFDRDVTYQHALRFNTRAARGRLFFMVVVAFVSLL